MTEKKSVAVKEVLLITGEKDREMKLGNSFAKRMKKKTLEKVHSMGHTHIREHHIRFGTDESHPSREPHILRMTLAQIGMSLPAAQAAAAPQRSLQL